MNEMTPILWRRVVANYTSSKNFIFWKVCAKVSNFRVLVYRLIQVWKDSLSEKLVLKYATLGFPFITGFPSHEWNETHP